MSQVQSATSAYYSMPWLYQSTQQSGPSSTSADSFFGATDPAQATDPFSASTQQSTSPSATPPFSLDAMSALIAAQAQQSNTTSSNPLSPAQQKVFSELDTNGDGTISQSELETDFGTNNKQLADAVFSKLDTNGDGSISQDEFGAGTTKTAHHGHHHHHMQADSSQSTDPSQDPTQSQDPLSALLNATPGQSTQTLSNSDGSTTTTITYADGSTVSTTSAPTATSSDNSSTNSNTSQSNSTQNLLEQLIQLQAQLTTASLSTATTALTI